MKQTKSLISIEKAISIISDTINPIERTSEISINDALGRVIAETIISKSNVPEFNRAAMDGYAVISDDTKDAPKNLTIIDTINAGTISNKIIKIGECIQVSTGCKMPSKSDAVIMVEDTEKIDGNLVKILKSVPFMHNVVCKGEDIKIGETILKKGVVLNPSKIGVLAAIGKKEVIVYDKPKIAIISTGNEIVKLGESLKDGFVYDINSYTLSAIIKENGGEPIQFGIIKDNYADIKKAIEKSLDCDLIVFSGGSSIGEKDILSDVISDMGVIFFHGVNIKPGKPTLFGIVKESLPVLVMPGYPTSCLSNGYRFLLPVIRVLSNLPEKNKIQVKVKIGEQIKLTKGKSQFLTVEIKNGYAYSSFKASSAITSMSQATGYLELSTDKEVIEKDELVEVVLF